MDKAKTTQVIGIASGKGGVGKTTIATNLVHGLNLQKIHFDTWLKHFIATTDEMFEGEKAETAKQRVTMLAITFYHKLHGVYESF